jgi:ATP-dependent RNA helicase DeaD
VTTLERFDLDRIAKRYGIEMIERTLPTDTDVEAVVAERLTALLEARLRDRDKLQAERSLRFVPLARSLSENEEESAVIAMLLDDYYQQMLHAPVSRPSDSPPAPAAREEEPSGRRGPRRDSRDGRRRRR